MARPRIAPAPEDPEDLVGDDLTEEEVRQAEVGSLFSLQGAEFDRVRWSIYRFRTRNEIAADPQGVQEEWVADRDGQLQGNELADALGGGTFHLYGFVPRADGRGTRIAFNRKVAIAGPRKDLAAVVTSPPPAVVTSPEPGLTKAERILFRMMKQQAEMSAAILARLAQPAPPPPAQTGIKELAETMVMLKGLTPAPSASPDKEIFGSMLGVLKEGIEIGQGREPAAAGEPGATDWGKVIEKALGLGERLVAARVRYAQSAARPASAPPSEARVVDDPPAPAPPPPPATDEMARARMKAAIDALARAIVNRDEPADFADTLIGILTEDELAEIENSPPELVIQELIEGAGGRYPVLLTDGGKAYIGAVLSELSSTGPGDAPSA
jgi:hypothetical protein